MKFAEYQKLTVRTLPNLHKQFELGDKMMTNLIDLVHMRLGLASELSELSLALRKDDKVNIGEELGDQLWYASNDLNICKKIGFITEEEYNTMSKFEFGSPKVTNGGYALENNPAWFTSLTFNIGELVDFVKKALAYGKTMDKALYLHHMNYLLGAINNIAYDKEINLEEYMDKNIAKLKARFPHKFEAEAAINRDHDKERQILEGEKGAS